MLKNYLKIASRNLNKQRMYSFINISGLAIGIACIIIAMLYKTRIGIEIYIFAAISFLLAASIALIFQSSEAAIKNPVDSLRIE